MDTIFDAPGLGANFKLVSRASLPIGVKFLATWSIFALTACGGGGGGSSPSTPSPPAAVIPTISAQPQNASVTVGESATFSVTAAGTAPISYQWMRGGTTISGASSATYSLASPALADNAAVFAVTVTNSAGSVTSSNATLTVGAPPTVSTAPAAATVSIGASAIFSVVAAGTGPFTYQWLKNGVAIPGEATSASYVLAGSGVADSGNAFSVTITSAFGSVTSAVASLRVTGISVFAGTPGGLGIVDGPLASARFELPLAIASDASGNLYVSDDNTIGEVSVAGTVTTLAGSHSILGSAQRYGATDGTGAAARFSAPYGIAVDATGNLYVTDNFSSTLREVTPAGVVSTVAGNAASASLALTPGALPGLLNAPWGVLVVKSNPTTLLYTKRA